METKPKRRDGRYFVAFDQHPEPGSVCICGLRHQEPHRVLWCAERLIGPNGRIGVVTRSDDELNAFTIGERQLFEALKATDRLCVYFRWPRAKQPREQRCTSGLRRPGRVIPPMRLPPSLRFAPAAE